LSSDVPDEKKSSRGGIAGWASNRGLIAKVSFAFFGAIFIIIIIVGAGLYYENESESGTGTSPPPETTTTTPDYTQTENRPVDISISRIQKVSAPKFVIDNFRPIANNQSITTSENKSIDITLTAHDEDLDDNLTGLIKSPFNGSLNLINENTGVVTYVPNPGFTGTDQFTFEVDDGTLGGNSTGTVRIAVKDNLRH
jgi:hypothetical protein